MISISVDLQDQISFIDKLKIWKAKAEVENQITWFN